ncbi:MAG: hypothetical protein AAF702_46250 [Chloroflexota bacterium]
MAYTKQITVLHTDPAIEEITSIIQGNMALAGNGSYLEVLRRMQLGQWEEVIPMLKLLKAQYPKARELDLLLSEVKLRADYESAWNGKIKGRQSVLDLARLSTKIVPIVLIALLAIGGALYYGQRSQVRALNNERTALMEQAQAAMLGSSFQMALDLYNEMLAKEPDYTAAQTGQSEAIQMLEIDSEYQRILAQIESGDTQDEVAALIRLQEKSPGFRDVPVLIKELQGQESLAERFTAAKVAFSAGNWEKAIHYYESVRLADSTYEAEHVIDRLVASHINTGLEIVQSNPAHGGDLNHAMKSFEKALKLKLGEPTARFERDMLDTYLYGQELLEDGKFARAIDQLLPIYQARSNYLDGYMVQSMYDAYIQLGNNVEADGDLRRAMGYYGKAAALKVTNRDVALAKLREVSFALTPTPTPTSTPKPYIPLPTATPVPLTLADLKGWILFRTNREGGSVLYVMRPDGSNAQPAPIEAREKFQEIFESQQMSPDGKSRLYVQKEKRSNGSTYNIYKERVDLPENWIRTSRMSDLDGTSYDPVWSPDNERVAFVSNVTGGDEIWVMHPDGRDHVQLTFNDWPWDKHPTFSPDGQQILFWSNRTGMRQLWLMNVDGSNQRQLTYDYDNWDPIWLK